MQASTYQLVIIGFGMAAHRLLHEYLQKAEAMRPKPRVLVLGDEPGQAYNRVLLPSLLEDPTTDLSLDGEFSQADKWAWYKAQQVDVRTGDAVVTIDPTVQQVKTAAGFCAYYQQLVFATGSTPSLAPCITPENQQRILSLRTLADAKKLQQLPAGSAIAVQGGGFIGLETAAALAHQYQVTLIHRGPYVMDRLLDATAATRLQHVLAKRGVRFRLQSQIQRAECSDSALDLYGAGPEGDWHEPCRVLVSALGIRPQTALAHAAGVKVNRGILVDSDFRTNLDGVFALGECSEYQGFTPSLVAPIYQQASVLAALLLHQTKPQALPSTACLLKISGFAVASIGDLAQIPRDDPQVQTASYQDPELGDYRRLWWTGDTLHAAVLCGDTQLTSRYQQWWQTGQAPAGSVAEWLFS